MISTFTTPQQDRSITATPSDETTPELRPWSTPCVQSLNGGARDTQGGTIPTDTGDILVHLS
jgi:hypothetical protein